MCKYYMQVKRQLYTDTVLVIFFCLIQSFWKFLDYKTAGMSRILCL